MHVYVCIYVCMHVCVCMYVSGCLCVYVGMCVCMFEYAVCVHVSFTFICDHCLNRKFST